MIVTLTIAALHRSGTIGSREHRAKVLFQRGKFEDVKREYSDLTWGTRACERLASMLFNAQQYGDLLRLYPNTAFADRAKQILGQREYDRIMQIQDHPTKLNAINEFFQRPESGGLTRDQHNEMVSFCRKEEATTKYEEIANMPDGAVKASAMVNIMIDYHNDDFTGEMINTENWKSMMKMNQKEYSVILEKRAFEKYNDIFGIQQLMWRSQALEDFARDRLFAGTEAGRMARSTLGRK
jgi:hypothetical protein